MTNHLRTILATGIAFVLSGVPVFAAPAADEAELKVWSFKKPGDAWSGIVSGKYGAWPVSNMAMHVKAEARGSCAFENSGLSFAADKANVVHIQTDAGSANKGRLWFTTGVSQTSNKEKMIEFHVKPGSGLQDYVFDLKSLPPWKDKITSLRFEFLGLKAQDEVSVRCIKMFYGEKISKPMVYTNFTPGLPLAVREFRLGFLFHDNMVLQRGKPVPVWGRGKPGEVVTVRFADQSKTATTAPSGKWQVMLDPMPASSEPRTLSASSPLKDHSVTVPNVVVGDVWLCGGQSNMGGAAVENAPPAARQQELLETDYPNFRFTGIPSQNRDTPLTGDAAEDPVTWRAVQAKPSRSFPPAVTYYFGQALHASQQVPIGMIMLIKAGSQVEQWLDAAALKAIFTEEELKMTCAGSHLASGLHNGMVAPLAPFPIRGAFWYQGESNSDNEARYMGYYKSLPALIKSWRAVWGGDLPVFLAQLPAFDGRYPPESWAYVREVQLLSSLHLPNVGLAVSFDEGDPKNLHPRNKYFIGTRLALAARAKAYGEKIEFSGPAYAGMERQGSGVSLRFTHVGAGLKARGELVGFELRGADQRWLPAKAAISDREHVLVNCPEIANPEAARYAWANSPTASLFNDSGLPASPFRTDVPVKLVETLKKAGGAPGTK